VTAGPPQSADDRVGLRHTLSGPVLRLQSDQRLVRLTRAGSGAAFTAIVERYRGPLVGYCGRLLGPDDAEDAVQQTFANALRALRADDRAIQLRPWLYRIAHNHAVNSLNRRGRDHEQLDEQYDGVPQPPDLFEQKERLERLVTAIDDLPERQRQAIVARELEGRSHDEIARTMHATTPVVRQLIHRARSRLRDACGVLVPISWLRWLLVSDIRAPAASERVSDAVAGGSAGAALLKTGAILLTTGAVATGGSGLVTGKHPAYRLDRHDPEPAQAQVIERSQGTGTGVGEPVSRPAAPAGPHHEGRRPASGADSGSPAPARDPRHEGERHDRHQPDRGEGDAEHSSSDEGDTASELPREASHQGSDGGESNDAGDGEPTSRGGGDSESTDPAEPPPPPEGSGGSDGSGSHDSPSGP
jgi:RNA polymerase sigma factor (sigma-70 family)